jgi:hypothetical protein
MIDSGEIAGASFTYDIHSKHYASGIGFIWAEAVSRPVGHVHYPLAVIGTPVVFLCAMPANISMLTGANLRFASSSHFGFGGHKNKVTREIISSPITNPVSA